LIGRWLVHGKETGKACSLKQNIEPEIQGLVHVVGEKSKIEI